VIEGVDANVAAVLDEFGFDEQLFDLLRARVATGELSPESNLIRGAIEPPAEEELTPLPGPGEPGHEAARAAGIDALRRGEVAQVVLAGGMATRFGGVVKAVLEAVDSMSFLEAKLSQTAALERALDTTVPVALMTSFATDGAIREHVDERGLGEPLVFHQFVSLRLEPSGDLFRDSDGAVSLYAPGHGDLFRALRESGTLAAFRDRGVRVVTVSNVDNLGARVDPVVVGAHLLAERPLTCEVARKEGDIGGAPVRVDGKLPSDVRPGARPGVQHEHGPRRPRCARGGL
jgi:UTP--glucose-1-phosphate uridylyltransferase